MVPRSWVDELSRLWDSILGIVEREQDLPPAPSPQRAASLGAPTPDPLRTGSRRGNRRDDSQRRRACDCAVEGDLSESPRRAAPPARVREAWRTPGPDRGTGPFSRRSFSRAGTVPTKVAASREWERRANERVSRLAEEPPGTRRRRHRGTDHGRRRRGDGRGHQLHTLHASSRANTRREFRGARSAADRAARSWCGCRFYSSRSLDRAAELRRPGWEAMLERLLVDGGVSWAAIRVALTHPCDDRLKQTRDRAGCSVVPTHQRPRVSQADRPRDRSRSCSRRPIRPFGDKRRSRLEPCDQESGSNTCLLPCSRAGGRSSSRAPQTRCCSPKF